MDSPPLEPEVQAQNGETSTSLVATAVEAAATSALVLDLVQRSKEGVTAAVSAAEVASSAAAEDDASSSEERLGELAYEMSREVAASEEGRDAAPASQVETIVPPHMSSDAFSMFSPEEELQFTLTEMRREPGIGIDHEEPLYQSDTDTTPPLPDPHAPPTRPKHLEAPLEKDWPQQEKFKNTPKDQEGETEDAGPRGKSPPPRISVGESAPVSLSGISRKEARHLELRCIDCHQKISRQGYRTASEFGTPSLPAPADRSFSPEGLYPPPGGVQQQEGFTIGVPNAEGRIDPPGYTPAPWRCKRKRKRKIHPSVPIPEIGKMPTPNEIRRELELGPTEMAMNRGGRDSMPPPTPSESQMSIRPPPSRGKEIFGPPPSMKNMGKSKKKRKKNRDNAERAPMAFFARR